VSAGGETASWTHVAARPFDLGPKTPSVMGIAASMQENTT